MRILFVQGVDGLGGSIHSLLWLAQEVAKSDDVTIGVVGTPASARLYEAVGLRVLRVGEPFDLGQEGLPLAETSVRRIARHSRQLVHTISAGIKFARMLRAMRFDLVHTNTAPPIDRAEVMGALIAGIPVVAHIRSFARITPLDRVLLKGIRQFIAVSSAASQPYRRAGVNQAAMNIVHNCVPMPEQLSDLDRMLGRGREGMAENVCWAVTAGRLVPGKGVDVAISAVAKVRATGIDLRLVVLGDGPEAENLHRQAADLSAEGAVVFLGWRPDAVRLIALGDILLQPSQAADSFPRTVIEGMAAGVPVVGTDMGGIAEAFEPGVSGLLASGTGPAPLVPLLARLAIDDSLRREMGIAARLEAERRYSPRVHAEAVKNVFSKAIGER